MTCGCESPKYAMEFIGWKDGVLIRGAPKLAKGTIQKNFLEYANLPHWRLIEPVPEVKKVPKAKKEESVYEEVDETKDEEAEPPEELVDEIDLMTVKELKIFIEHHGGTVDSKWLKPDLVREARKYVEESLRMDSGDPTPDEYGDPPPATHGDAVLEEHEDRLEVHGDTTLEEPEE